MTAQEFENGFQGLLSLSKMPSTIDEFVLLYQILLITNRGNLLNVRTLAEVLECKARGNLLKEILLKQVGYVKDLRAAAMMDDDDALAQAPGIDAG